MGAAVSLGRAAARAASAPPEDAPDESTTAGRWCSMCELGASGDGVRVQAEPTMHFRVTTHTGTAPGSGSDANVYVVLYGHSGGVSERHQLDHDAMIRALIPMDGANLKDVRAAVKASVTMHESAAVDTFHVETPPFGELVKIRIGHDGGGLGPGWFLAKVVVERVKSGRHGRGEVLARWEFPCERWLDTEQDDFAVERTLQLAESDTTGEGAESAPVTPGGRGRRGLEPAVVAKAVCTIGPSLVLSKQSSTRGLLAWSVRVTGQNSLFCIGAVPADCKDLDTMPPNGAWCVSSASGLAGSLGGVICKPGDRFRVVADLDLGALTIMQKQWDGREAADESEGWREVVSVADTLHGEVRLGLCLWGGGEVWLVKDDDLSMRRLLRHAQKRDRANHCVFHRELLLLQQEQYQGHEQQEQERQQQQQQLEPASEEMGWTRAESRDLLNALVDAAGVQT